MRSANHLPRKIFIGILMLVIVFIMIACGGTVATQAPADEPTSVVVLTPTQTQEPLIIPTTTGGEDVLPAILETRRLTLEYPARMKAGVEGDIIRLTLELDDLGNITPTAQIGGNIVTGGVIEIPNLYETHFVTAEARIDMAGMELQPSGSIFEPMKPGQSVTFHWSIRPQETGVYRGIVWLHLGFEDRVSREKSRMAVSAQIVEIEAVDFFGFSVNIVRTSGVIGSVIGLVVGFPFFDDILKYLFTKRRKRRK